MKNHQKKSTPLYHANDLIDFASKLFQKAGLSLKRAEIVANTLTESDLMGHTTHGLQLLPVYINQLEIGGMTKSGEPKVVSDHGASIAWDGKYLPGPWLVHKAIDIGLERLKTHPVFTLSIRRSHHIACLAAYLERATEKGFMILLASADPANKTVAPYGGLKGTYSPDPIAAGIPTEGDPILIDISASTTANGVVIQKHNNGEKLPHPWLLDPNGNITDDPGAFFADPPATILPLGGLDTGYKGFALGLIIEALTFGLAGYGRSSGTKRWEAGIFLQLINPEAFGGLAAFNRESTYISQECRNSPTRPGDPPVRIPGDRARKLRAYQKEHGLWLYPTIMPGLKEVAERYDVEVPEEILNG